MTDYMKFFAKETGFIKKQLGGKSHDPHGFWTLFSDAFNKEVAAFSPGLIIVLGCDLTEPETTNTALVNAKKPSEGFDVQQIEFGEGLGKRAVMTAYHPSGARGKVTPKIRDLVRKETESDPQQPIVEYYRLIAQKACEYLSRPGQGLLSS